METTWTDVKPLLLDCILKTVKDFGFTAMTPVQTACIPLLLNYKDVAAEAVTGSGKTLAFLIPTIQMLVKCKRQLKKHDVGALVVSPTRELASQTYEVLQSFLQHISNMTSMLLVGGSDVQNDIEFFEKFGAHIIICTPGRLSDILSRTNESVICLAAGVKSLEVLILDEADKLLDLGFTATLNTILAYLPKQRRTGLFSATQTSDVIKLIRAGLRNPVQVRVKENGISEDKKMPSTLSNYYTITKCDEKFGTLLCVLEERKNMKVMIFFLTCACVEYFSFVLRHIFKEVSVLEIHGKMKKQRQKVFNKFRQLKTGFLICTDVMCRGVDIPEVDWVIQFDPPSSAASYVHRCGRTARIGNKGAALLFLQPCEDEYVHFIQVNQNVKLHEYTLPSEIKSCLNIMRELQLSDRAVMDKANRAFVSYIQAYSKHECTFILNLRKLDFGLLAITFGLLTLPKMPELKNKVISNFTPVDIDFNTVQYKNKEKENSRKYKLLLYNETGKWPGLKSHKPKTLPWSRKKARLAKKKAKREKRALEKQKREKHKFSEQELNELVADARLVKKFKSGKVSADCLNEIFECNDNNKDPT